MEPVRLSRIDRDNDPEPRLPLRALDALLRVDFDEDLELLFLTRLDAERSREGQGGDRAAVTCRLDGGLDFRPTRPAGASFCWRKVFEPDEDACTPRAGLRMNRRNALRALVISARSSERREDSS